MKLRGLLFATVLVFSISACSERTKEKTPAQEIVVGLYGSMTGNTATLGQSSLSGARLAMEELNSKGGVLGKQIRLVSEDDQGKPEEALTVVTKLINRDKVVAVLGENASSRSLAAAPVCQQNRIPMISPS